MDDLDRLAFRLVRTTRDSYPHWLAHGFSLSDLEERLLPFRETRREMADGGASAWESMVLRLVSGEREYIVAEEGLQSACRVALAHPSPTMALVRPWATSTLRIGSGISKIGPTRDQNAVTGSSGVQPARTATVGTRSAHEDAAHAVTLPVRGCRYCSCRLPDARRVTFCPHCGHDLTIRQCPACSTELEMGWRFCVTCGRGADLPDFPSIVSPAKAAGA